MLIINFIWFTIISFLLDLFSDKFRLYIYIYNEVSEFYRLELMLISAIFMPASQLLERIGPATEKLKNKGIDFSLWYKPENYRADV